MEEVKGRRLPCPALAVRRIEILVGFGVVGGSLSVPCGLFAEEFNGDQAQQRAIVAPPKPGLARNAVR
jgi:hypothetical protein